MSFLRHRYSHTTLFKSILLVLMGMVVAEECSAQTFRFTLNQRRRADQIWVEIWCKSMSTTPTRLGEATLRVNFNPTYLSLANYGLSENNPDKSDSIRFDIANLSASSQTAAVVPVNSPFDPDFYATPSNYQGLVVGTSIPGIAELQVKKTSVSDTGFVPSSLGRGSFVGKIVFTINSAFQNATSSLRDTATTFVSWGAAGNASVVYNYNDVLIGSTALSFVNPGAFTIKGVTILNPNGPSEVVDRDGSYYTTAILGYPIYFERSGISSVSTVGTAGTTNEYGDQELSYYLDYRLTTGGAYFNIGSINEAGAVSNTGAPLDQLTDGSGTATWDGLVTQYGNPINTANGGASTVYPNYRHPVRVVWTQNSNYIYRSEQAQLRIRTRNGASGASGNAPPTSFTTIGSDVSDAPFILGRLFFAQLNGTNQYFRSTQNYVNASELTVEAWVNLNSNKGTGANPGIIATGLGPNTQEGAWILYLRDGIFPAFRAREILGRDNGYLADLVSTRPITVSSDAKPISAIHSQGWHHIAATVNNNIVTLYVDGEIVARRVNTFATNMRMLLTNHPLWIGVNPHGTTLAANDYLHAGIKGVRIWRTELSQTQLRQRASGIPDPAGATATFTSSDLRKGLEYYFDFEGRNTDLASQSFYQNSSQPITYNAATTTASIVYRPDQPHIRITSPQTGVGVSNRTGQDYEIRWLGYGLGNISGDGSPDNSRDIAIEYSFNNTTNWTIARNNLGTTLANNLGYSSTVGTGAIVDVESTSAIWRPFNNESSNADGGGTLNLRNLGSYSRNGYLRIRGLSANGEENLSASVGPFIFAPYFALRKGADDSIKISAGSDLNINSTKAMIEAWIRPYTFPTGTAKYPIMAKQGADGTLHYAFSLLPSGQLEFQVQDLNGQVRTAVSDSLKPLIKPRTEADDSTWTHIAVFFDRSANQSQVGFWIDGILQSSAAIVNQLGTGLRLDSLNTFPAYIGYQPGVGSFIGEMREIRFWNGEPAGTTTTDARRQQIQGAQSQRLSSGVNLVTAYNFNGGSFVNGTSVNAMYNHTLDNTADIQTTFNGTGLRYVAARPFIKVVEPIFNESITNGTTDYRLRWVGFDYDNVSFTAGANAPAPVPPSLEFSLGGGGGNSQQPFQYVTSPYFAALASYGNAVGNEANQGFRITNAGTSSATGNDFVYGGLRYAARFNLNNADPDLNDDGVYNDPAPLSAVLTSARLRLRASISYNNLTGNDTISTISNIFTITPPSNFSVRAILEGYHEGIETANASPSLSTASAFRALGNNYQNGGLKIKLYSNVGNAPGALIDSAESLSGYHPNAFTTSAIQTNLRSNNVDGPLFALVPFVFTAVPDDRYFVVVQHRNHLPVMSRIPAVFAYSGDNYSTYQNESGWDFTNWNGGINAVSALTNSPNDPATNAHSNRYAAYGVFTSDSTDINYGITGLIHNEGRDESGTASNRVSSMVAGDINQDTWIDATDRVIVRNEAGATVNLRSDIDGSGTIDATDRTIVDRNIGRRSSLYQVIPNLKSEADKNHTASLMMMSEQDKQVARAMNETIENALIRGTALQENDGHYADAKAEDALQAASLKYQVSAEPKIVGDKVEVPLFITNNGDDFALANCTFAIKFNPTVLRFTTLSGAENVIFKNVDNTTSYQGIVHGPRPGVVNTIDNFRSIEILFDAALKSNKGVNVPKTKTYLGTLVFDMIQKNRAIVFDWFNTSVWTTTGRNVTRSGNFLPIPPLLTYSATVTVPNGGERYAVRRPTAIQWSSVSPAAVHVEWSKDAGKTWSRISFDPMSANANTLGWQTPGTPSFNNLIRIIDAETGIELDRSDAPFTIAAIIAGISRPASTDPVYKFGSTDNIVWASDGIDNARFEFTDNAVADFGWKQVVPSRRASDGKTQWTVPANVNTTRAIVRMIDMYDQQEVARSGEFKVLAGTLTFTYPREDVKLKANAKDRMRWSIKNNVKIADIEFSSDGGVTWVTVKENVDVTKGILDWTIPSVNTTQGVLRAVYPKTPELEYDRTTFFTISGAISSAENEYSDGVAVSLPTPNPANQSTTITIEIPSRQYVTIEIVNLLGQVVATVADNTVHETGRMSVAVDTKELMSGMYYVRVQCGKTIITRNLVINHEQ